MMTLFHKFSAQHKYQDLLFIFNHEEKSDKMKRTCCEYVIKLFNIIINHTHQKFMKQCKYVIFTLIFLCQFFNLHQTSLANYIEPASSNSQQPVISLRQISVPIFSSQVSDEYKLKIGSSKIDQEYTNRMRNKDKDYSINNRGFEPKSNFRFGERTRYPISIFKSRQQKSEGRKDEPFLANSVKPKLKDNILWSQPDPRKTYSIPIELVEAPKRINNRLELGRKLKIGEYPSRRFLLSASLTPANMKRSSENVAANLDLANVISKPNAAQDNYSRVTPERDEEQQSLWKSSIDLQEGDTEQSFGKNSIGSANRRKSYPQANMVTLIRYLPVLMSVPAEQVVVATAPDRPGLSGGGPAIKTGNSNQASSDDNAISVSSTTSSPLPAAAYYRLYRPSSLPVKYQVSQQEDLSGGVRQSYQGSELASPNQSNLSPSSSPQAANTLVGDFEIPPDFAASSLSGQYPQAGFFIQPAGSSAHETISSSPLSAKFGQFHVGNQQIAQQTHSGPSKAISAYAAKLISMLRPSSLLASIGPSPASNTVNSAPAFYPTRPSMSQPEIYLLAPAETVLPQQHSSRPLSSSQLVKPEDLLLNQATKLHLTTKLSSYQQQQQSQSQPQQQQQQHRNTDWIHQQANGLICVHSLVQGGGSKMSAQVTNQELKPPVYGASDRHQITTTTTNAPILGNQQTTDVDQSSFDYIPAPSSTTEYTPSAAKKQQQQQQQLRQSGKIKGKQNSGQFNKESPVKLAQKLSKKLKTTSQVTGYTGFDSNTDPSGIVQEPLSDDFGDKQAQHQHQHQQQQNFLGSSSESRSVIEDNQVEGRKVEEPAASSVSQVERNESVRRGHDNASTLTLSKKSIIPFTIKDKIDLPTRRGHQHLNKQQSSSSIQAANPNRDNPVEYDEPSEGEIELQSNSVGKHQRQLQRYSWPAHLQSNHYYYPNQDERRVKTSFVSQSSSLRPPKRKLEKESLPLELNNIDYSKESTVSFANGRQRASSLDAGYTLPLLMASSTSMASPSSSGDLFKSGRKHPKKELGESRVEHQEQRHEVEASSEIVQPAFMRPSVIFGSPPPITTTTSTTTALPSPTNTESMTAPTERAGPSMTAPSTLNDNELNGLNAAASSSVTTSSTLDGQPVILKSGRLSSYSLDSSNAKLGAGTNIDSSDSPPGFLLVSSSSLSSDNKDNNNTSSYNNSNSNSSVVSNTLNKYDEAKKTAADQTVEFLVNSSPHEQETSGKVIGAAAARLATVKRRYSMEISDKDKVGAALINDTQVFPPLLLKRGLPRAGNGSIEELEVDKNATFRGLENHSLDGSSSENKAFSNFRLISPESPAEEFAKLSESLQTNPLDLIDLQNSRSSFELPSQLESLAMLYSSSHHSAASSESPNSLASFTQQSNRHSSLPSHQHEHQNQVSSSSNGWPASIDTARHRRTIGQSHARRLR